MASPRRSGIGYLIPGHVDKRLSKVNAAWLAAKAVRQGDKGAPGSMFGKRIECSRAAPVQYLELQFFSVTYDFSEDGTPATSLDFKPPR